MTEWASVLPGFDRTRHEVNHIKVRIHETTATATADVVAYHWVGDLFWHVKGDYVYKLHKDEDQWLIDAHQFNFKEEEGTRDVFALAIKNATSNPVSYIKRQQTKQAVSDFLTALEEKDMEAFASVWADDAVQDMPYAPEGFPSVVQGKENLITHYANWPDNSGKADFTSKLRFYPMQDPEMVFVEFKGTVDIIPTARTYHQQYVGVFHVVDGKIKLFREYFNPVSFVYAFGLDKKTEN